MAPRSDSSAADSGNAASVPRFSAAGGEAGGFDPSIAETHVSLVIFAGDRAFKLKKPIRTPFLDFTSTELRRQACERELELNRRLAPDVYLGVAAVLGPDREPCDYLLVMRRMPAERRLSRLVRSASGGECLEEVAGRVARFHTETVTSAEIGEQGRREAVLRRWEDNLAEMARFAGELPANLLERVGALARAFLAGRDVLFEQRIAEGRVRDGHGDLLADDIYCLEDGPRILDCLEFDDQLRYVDVLDDAAFLAMDLERLGAPELADRFLDSYRQAEGGDHPASLAHHYIAYRAGVRAKIALLRHDQGDPEALAEAVRLLQIASRHLEAARVVLVLVGGLPGTGKSTLAQALAADRGWEVLRSDVVRKQLAEAREPSGDGRYGEGLYRQEVTDATYRSLLESARSLLSRGRSVVLDASWSPAPHREAAALLAGECSAALVALRCEAPMEVAAGRLTSRRLAGSDPSDATPAIAKQMSADFAPWPEASVVDTSRERGSALRDALQALDRSLKAALP